jgi:excinuclease ABC subunit A
MRLPLCQRGLESIESILAIARDSISRDDRIIMTSTSISAAAGPSPRIVRQIELRGVRVHNLKHVDLDVPLGRWVVFSGVSGSGKSSLAFDTIFAEGQRRYIESFSASARQYLERIERPNADRIAHVPPPIAIRTDCATRGLASHGTVASLAEIDTGLRRLFSRVGRVLCPDCRLEVRPRSALDLVRAAERLPAGTRFQIGFSSTSQEGAGTAASWLARGFSRAIFDGKTQSLGDLPGDLALPSAWIIADRLTAAKTTSERIAESAESAFREGNGRCLMLIDGQDSAADGTAAASVEVIDGRPWRRLPFSRHWECSTCRREFLPPSIRLFDPDFGGGCPSCRGTPSAREECSVCRGSRLAPPAMSVWIGQTRFADVVRLPAAEARQTLLRLDEELEADERRSSRLLLDDIHRRLKLVVDLGLGHLALMRSVSSLSGGQIRRLMFGAVIGSGVTGTLCLIDEPSAGLHPTEIPLLIQAIRTLVDQRNSVIVVDHAPEIVLAADHVVDLGPGAGPQGGIVIFSGTPEDLRSVGESATGRFLADPSGSNPRRTRRKAEQWLTLNQIRHHHLSCETIRIPLGVLCLVTGPGGSGKTSLVMDVLLPALREQLQPTGNPSVLCTVEGADALSDAVVIDRTPLTRSSRSNAATWIEVFDEIRDVFAMTAEARQRGFGSQHFSFNAAQGGRCRACHGTGHLKHDMQFLPDVTLACPECGGTRFRRDILEIKYRGRSIAEVLAMSASEAAAFFRNHPRLQGRLQMLKQIGLDYLVLGQPTDTLSGGEAQRLKLAARLTASQGPTLIICDQPTAGLHPADVTRLTACFDELIGIGHSILLIDNSPELIRAADFVIPLPPQSRTN